MSSINTNAQENYEYIKCLPIVSKLIKENKKLKRKNKDLKKLIKLITRNASLLSGTGPIQNGTSSVSTFGGNANETPNISYQINETINVKKEPPNAPIHFNHCDDSDIEIIDKPCESIDIISLCDDDVIELKSINDEDEDEEEVEVEEEEEEEEDEVAICFRCESESHIDSPGGDWGENEEWVCAKCLPLCKSCGKQLFQRRDECCGVGRDDDEEDEEEEDAIVRKREAADKVALDVRQMKEEDVEEDAVEEEDE